MAKIPKIIWTYWHSFEDMPKLVQNCIESWKKYNKGYIINVITSKTLPKYVGYQESWKIKHWKFVDSVQRVSDLIRLSVLTKYGGIWLDASCMCFESFDWVNDLCADTVFYHIPEISHEIVPESWFIACSRENEYIKKVNKEFRDVSKWSSIKEYTDSLTHIDKTGIEDKLDYLLIYIVMKKVLQEHSWDKSIKILNASEGPYLYQKMGGIDKVKEKPKFFKFRKQEREIYSGGTTLDSV